MTIYTFVIIIIIIDTIITIFIIIVIIIIIIIVMSTDIGIIPDCSCFAVCILNILKVIQTPKGAKPIMWWSRKLRSHSAQWPNNLLCIQN